MYGLLNDPHFVALVLSCAAIITIGLIVTALVIALTKIRRLQNEVSELSEHVREWQAAEHKRFMKELKGADPAADRVGDHDTPQGPRGTAKSNRA